MDAFSVSSVAAKLVADGVLLKEEQTAILSQDSATMKNAKMLQYLSHKGPGAFYSFCRNVRSESEKGANVIQYLAGELHDLDPNIAFADKVSIHACTPDTLPQVPQNSGQTCASGSWEGINIFN